MPTSLLVAASVLSLVIGAPWPIPAILLATAISPWAGAAVAIAFALHAWMRRRHDRSHVAGTVAMFLRALGADVSRGATLRQAIADSDSALVGDDTRRLCVVGAPMPVVAASLASALGASSEAFTGVCRVSESTGASVSRSLLVMAEFAEEAEELDRNRRSAVAQSRFSAGVVGILPLVVGSSILVARGIPEPGGAMIVIPIVLGASLMLAGSALVWVISSRAVTP